MGVLLRRDERERRSCGDRMSLRRQVLGAYAGDQAVYASIARKPNAVICASHLVTAVFSAICDVGRHIFDDPTSSCPVPSRTRCAITESFTIRYRRPQAPWSVVKMVVPGAGAATAQIDRLKALGYSIIDVEPVSPKIVPQG